MTNGERSFKRDESTEEDFCWCTNLRGKLIDSNKDPITIACCGPMVGDDKKVVKMKYSGTLINYHMRNNYEVTYCTQREQEKEFQRRIIDEYEIDKCIFIT